MIKKIWQADSGIEAVIVGEPTEMKVATSHKGAVCGIVKLTGLEAHSSKTDIGVSAVHHAIRLMSEMDKIADELARQIDDDTDISPPYSTLNIGMVNGGNAANIIAKNCVFTFDYRYMPGSDSQKVIDRILQMVDSSQLQMKQKYDKASIELSIDHVLGLSQEQNGAAQEIAQMLTGENETISVPFGTEAGLFQKQGFSTIVCGPGSVRQAHKPNEFIKKSQVQSCANFIGKLIERQSI